MARPRLDTFDAAAIRDAIAHGKTTPRLAYEAYCSTAARPYARSTWEVLLRRPVSVLGSSPGTAPLEIAAPWNDWSHAKPATILTTVEDNAGLKVKGGALHVIDGSRTLVYEKRSVKPRAIVMTGWAGFVTIEAMRFCSDHGVALVILDWTREFMTVNAPPAWQSARLIRAQALADRFPSPKR